MTFHRTSSHRRGCEHRATTLYRHPIRLRRWGGAAAIRRRKALRHRHRRPVLRSEAHTWRRRQHPRPYSGPPQSTSGRPIRCNRARTTAAIARRRSRVLPGTRPLRPRRRIVYRRRRNGSPGRPGRAVATSTPCLARTLQGTCVYCTRPRRRRDARRNVPRVATGVRLMHSADARRGAATSRRKPTTAARKRRTRRTWWC
mmetsp:Transcript_228/g.895  ORF Transcript_228/g.895 Transcript_228/m.895 type:complete len:200 (-) Transcript_228:654-1253(-)